MICLPLRWPAHTSRVIALLLAATGAHAEPLSTAAQTVTVPAYSSAFASYKAYTEQPVASWREANNTVGRIGGWRSYAKESAQEETPSAPAIAASTSAPTSPDEGHGGRP